VVEPWLRGARNAPLPFDCCGKGLHQLDYDRWEDKWLEITGQVKQYYDDDYDSDEYYTGQGSAMIKEIVNDWALLDDDKEEQEDGDEDEEECYTPERVASYLVARHSYEVCTDMQFYGKFSGRASRGF